MTGTIEEREAIIKELNDDLNAQKQALNQLKMDWPFAAPIISWN